MTEHFNEVQQCVKVYFNKAILQGLSLIAIIDGFRDGPLPKELLNNKTCSGLTEREIRRHGQLIGTKYLILQNNQQSASLSNTDLLGDD